MDHHLLLCENILQRNSSKNRREINPFLTALRRRGIIVTAVHNHWLFENPRLMYMHWENVGDPFPFARNSFEAAKKVGLF